MSDIRTQLAPGLEVKLELFSKRVQMRNVYYFEEQRMPRRHFLFLILYYSVLQLPFVVIRKRIETVRTNMMLIYLLFILYLANYKSHG